MTEAQFLAAVRQLARLRGWRCYHTHDSRRSEPGFPDLVLIHAGRKRLIFAELKTETGRLSAEQRAWLADLDAVGATAYVWRPTDLQRVIPAVLGGATLSENRARTDRERNSAEAGSRGQIGRS